MSIRERTEIELQLSALKICIKGIDAITAQRWPVAVTLTSVAIAFIVWRLHMPGCL